MNPINIAEILKNYPEGTKFWSDSLGNIKLVGVDEKNIDDLPICVTDEGGKEFKFTKEGNFNKYSGSAFPSIMPSQYMNSWNKLLWKKGDILLNKVEEKVVTFDSIASDFSQFIGANMYDLKENSVVDKVTLCFALYEKCDTESIIQMYHSKVKSIQGNNEKEIELKDGDVIRLGNQPSTDIQTVIFRKIVPTKKDNSPAFELFFYAGINLRNEVVLDSSVIIYPDYRKIIRLTTDEENAEFFKKLSDHGLAWKPRFKRVNFAFKPMDWVLMNHNDKDSKWVLCQYSHTDIDRAKYIAVGGVGFNQCIPYNNLTKDFLGTTTKYNFKFNFNTLRSWISLT